MDNNIQIVHEGNHYNVYVAGTFFCEADMYEEAVNELKEEGFV